MKIVVFGANGQLGRCLQDKFRSSQDNVKFFSKSQLDITAYNDVKNKIEIVQPDFIVNASAYTNVEKAETDFKNANEINHYALHNISDIAKKTDSVLIHISTDYVFDGKSNQPYTEDYKTNPITKYGLSKLDGERAIISSGCKAIIIRTSWVYSEYGNNFFKTMLSLRNKNTISVVDDQIGCPTYAQDLAQGVKIIIKNINDNKHFNNWGIYNFCGKYECSWFRFAEMIFFFANKCGIETPKELLQISSKSFSTKAKRPKYSVLSNKKIFDVFNIKSTDLESGIRSALKKYQTMERDSN